MLPSVASADSARQSWQPDQNRVVLHCDIDSFYAQTETINNPALQDLPVAVTQKYLCVTSNYKAREHGVTKLMSVRDAVACCPQLVLISGEDLTPYRRASRTVLAVLSRFGVVEKGGMDEAFLDVTREARRRVSGGDVGQYQGHVHHNQVILRSVNPHRPMDLTAGLVSADIRAAALSPVELGDGTEWGPLLRAGSAIAEEARSAVKASSLYLQYAAELPTPALSEPPPGLRGMQAETGFRTSAGIACNKMLAKLVSGIHKPDDQTVLLPIAATEFMTQLPLRAIPDKLGYLRFWEGVPGVGYKMSQQLEALQLRTAADLRKVSSEDLIRSFGDRIGAFLFQAARGKDSAPVKPSQPPKAVTVEDSFKSCATPAAAAHVLKILAPDLLRRLQEEFEETGRQATTLLLKWRIHGSRWQDGHGRASTSCLMPPVVHSPFGGETQAHAIEQAATKLLLVNVSTPFNLTLLNLGASKFSGGSSGHISTFFPKQPAVIAVPSVPHDAWLAAGARDSTAAAAAAAAAAASAATTARRDYGAAPSGAPLSKQDERALRETSRAAPGAEGASAQAGRPPSRTALPAAAGTCPAAGPKGGHSSDSGDDVSADEWTDILQSQRPQPLQSGAALAMRLPGPQGDCGASGCDCADVQSNTAAGTSTTSSSQHAPQLQHAADGLAASPAEVCVMRPSEQVAVRQEAAQQLQQTQARFQANSRPQSREACFLGATAAGSQPGRRMPTKRSGGPTIETFFYKRR